MGLFVQGLSPRMRGNRVAITTGYPFYRSIPAHAGEPRSYYYRISFLQVYPRACGGTLGTLKAQLGDWGLSPRMRGNLSKHLVELERFGSIPAHAGGTSPLISPRTSKIGLSPRMRGNRAGRTFFDPFKRSIPAHAGEPWLPVGT